MMAATPNEQARRSAEQASKELKRLFDQLGNAEHPRGELLTAYRSARRQIAQNALDLAIVLGVLATLRRDVQGIAAGVFVAALAIGEQQARRDTGIHGLPLLLEPVSIANETAAILALYDAQAAQIRGLVALGDKTLIIGDEERVGVLAPGRIATETTRWITTLAVGGYMAHMLRSTAGQQEKFGRQAVAVIDRRTTQTCQNVNGQVVGLNEPFKVSGSPSYGSELMNPPFHDRCRTTVSWVRL